MTTPPATPPPQAPPAIQAHGVLLALDAEHRVVVASANTAAMLGTPVETVLGAPLATLVGGDVTAIVARRAAEGYPGEPLVVVLGSVAGGELAGREVDVRVHAAGERTVVELEAVDPGSGTAVSYHSARTAMTRLARVGTVAGLTALLAQEVADLTGFDRVTVHRFDEHHDGEVVAEVCGPGLEQFLGRRYPASDVPPRARRRSTLDPVRLVADVGRGPVGLSPDVDPGTGVALDLSHASLRAPSPTQVQRLAALGVRASMSVSIIIDDRLWGLVVCHHHSGPHRPSHDARAAAEFVTQVASHLVAHRERADARDAAVETQAALSALAVRLNGAERDVLDALFADPGLLEVLGATGSALMFDGRLRTAGVVPPPEVVQRIADALDVPDAYLTCTSHLASHDPGLAAVEGLAWTASGVLRVGTLSDRWGLWFRPERSALTSPGRSDPWEPWHQEAAEELGRHINSLLLIRSREQIAMAESMQRNVVLDRAPGFAGIELVARYRPASTYQLGGDWWDAFELTDRRLAFVVGDVAGHGVAAASAMTQVRTALRAYLYEGHSPAQCLDRLDALMDGLLDFGIATAVVAVLDLATGRVEIANAGHPAPLLVGAHGGAVEVQMDVRPLLGVGMGEAPTVEVDLGVDELLVLFTDGLVERRGFDLGERTERFRQLAAGRRDDEDVEGWADRIFDVLDTTDDDTTLLAVRRLG